MTDETQLAGLRSTQRPTAEVDMRELEGIGPGSMILNNYRVVREVARGGMGALYEAQHDITGERVAIKAILEEYAADTKTVRLFEMEAKALSKVKHPAIVGYRDILRDQGGRLFIIMDFVDGKPLSDFVGAATLPPEGVQALGKRLSGGLAAAHAVSVVHRDMTPANILLPDGDIEQAVIIDFGIAKNVSGEEGTVIGDSFAGTIQYASPEQLGLFGGNVDQRSDVYSLGVVLAMIAGQTLDIGDNMGTAAVKRQSDIVIGSEVPQPLRSQLSSMLRADPAARPSDILSIWNAPPVQDTGPAQTASPATADQTTTNRASGSPASEVTGGPGPRTVVEMPKKKSSGPMLVVVALLLAFAVAGATAFVMFNDEISKLTGIGGKSGAAIDQVAMAREIVEDPTASTADKLEAAAALIRKGGEDNLNAALRTYQVLSAEGNAEASFRVGRMYDPKYYDASTSPFSKANPRSARRLYKKAQDQGHPDAAAELSRLE